MTLTPHFDLRTGKVCWQSPKPVVTDEGALPATVDIVIIGAGVTGAMIAERLTAQGRQVVLFDRRAPASGATAASTALVMWAADTPLSTLSGQVGQDKAGRSWRAVFEACRTLDRRIATLGLDCGWSPRPEVYLAGDLLDEAGLALEADHRRAAGLPSTQLGGETVADRFGLQPRAALVSAGTFAVDPVALTSRLLEQAVARGARIYWPAEVTTTHSEADGVRVILADGREILARHLILASGYEAARPTLPKAFALSSSFAIATAPDQPFAWREQAMVWEASETYLYARPTTDGRLVFGGLDEDSADPDRRDALLPGKRRALEAAASRLIGHGVTADCAWAATFGTSPDGLPAIGRDPADDRVWLAYAFGGNGVTFASLAAGLITNALSGASDDDTLALFSPYRFEA